MKLKVEDASSQEKYEGLFLIAQLYLQYLFSLSCTNHMDSQVLDLSLFRSSCWPALPEPSLCIIESTIVDVTQFIYEGVVPEAAIWRFL